MAEKRTATAPVTKQFHTFPWLPLTRACRTKDSQQLLQEINNTPRLQQTTHSIHRTLTISFLFKNALLFGFAIALYFGLTLPAQGVVSLVLAVGVLSTFIDALITTYTRDRSEELQTAWEFNQQAVRISPVSVIVYDMGHQSLVYANEGSETAGGIPKEQIGRTKDLVNQNAHPDDIIKINEHQECLRHLKDGEWLDLHYRWYHQDGSLRHLFSRSTPFARDEKGLVSHFISATVDLTTTKQIESSLNHALQTLETERYQLKEILDSTTTGWWNWNLANPKDWYLSPAFLLYLGYTAQEIPDPAKVWTQVIHPEDLAAANELLKLHLGSDGLTPFRIEIRFRHKMGHYVWTLATGKALKDAEGKFYRMVGIYTDISKQKLLQNRLLQSNNELGQFTHIAAHDLRAPIRAITCWIDVLRSALPPDRSDLIDKAVTTVKKSAASADHLITDLLKLSDLHLNSSDHQAIDTTNLVRRILTPYQAKAELMGDRIDLSDLPTLTGDLNQLENLFSNLIQNAFKYKRPETPLHLQISAEKHDDYFEFSVKDNGIGIAAEHLKIIFNIFTRLHSADRIPGTGIGLAICHKIIELNGGRIWVESTPNVGSTFKFTWPIRRDTT